MTNNIAGALLLVGLITITACAEESATDTTDSALTGKRFFDAAATKLMSASSGMERSKANCIVEGMTADGKIGLGEINQSKLDEHGVPMDDTLRNAYVQANKACGK